ncbi:MAG: chlorophyll a/b-binding protein [Cyanobacteria bacterium J06560_2]
MNKYKEKSLGDRMSAPSSSSQSAPEEATAPDEPLQPSFGWSQYAEQLNGRFAMVGFVSLLLLELITHQDFFSWIGLR